MKERSIKYYKTPLGKEPAKDWLNSIKDKLTQAIIFKRIRQMGFGNFGKIQSVGIGIQEMKIDFGPGYRVYFGIHGDEIILILLGGHKKTQSSDIQKAKTFWIQWKEMYDEKE